MARGAWLCLLLVVSAAGCGGAAREPPAVSGAAVAFGAGAGGAGDACFTCHGFSGEGGPNGPRLAGIGAGYIVKQLEDYAHKRRVDPVMTAIAARLSPNDRLAVAAHYGAGTPVATSISPPPIFLVGDPKRGILPCADCHGEWGEGRGAGSPAIAGQPAGYTIKQLQSWRNGARRNDGRDVMGQAARPLRDEEITAIAAFLARRP